MAAIKRRIKIRNPRPLVWELADLVSPIDIATHYGINRNTPMNWAARYDDYPAALTFIGGRYVYSLKEIIAWHSARDWGAWSK